MHADTIHLGMDARFPPVFDDGVAINRTRIEGPLERARAVIFDRAEQRRVSRSGPECLCLPQTREGSAEGTQRLEMLAPFAVNIRRSSKSETEMRNLLTPRRDSLEKRRIQANVCRRGPKGATTPTLRDRKRRTESSGNVCSNWGYLAGWRKTDCVNQRGVGVRRDRIWLLR